MVLAIFCFIKGSYFLNIVGLLLIFINEYFDNIDGMLARRIGKSSEAGSYFDRKLNIIGADVLVVSIAFGIIRSRPGLLVL